VGVLLEKPVDEPLQCTLVSVDVNARAWLYTRNVLYPRVYGTKDDKGGGIHKVAVAKAVGSNVPDVPATIGRHRGPVGGPVVWGYCEPLHHVGLPRLVVADEEDFLCALHFLECNLVLPKKYDISFQFF